LKPVVSGNNPLNKMSPPARGRGLKLLRGLWIQGDCVSPPARGRGLKLKIPQFAHCATFVAPRAGAWIESEAPPAELEASGCPLKGGY